MDYLQEAIERARQKREGVIGRTPPPGTRTTRTVDRQQQARAADGTVAPSTVIRGNGAVTGVPARQVVYSQTRTVQPDQKVLADNRIIAWDIDDPRVEAYRQLRSQVLSAMKRNGWKTLLITGPRENVGKSLTAVNLALSISHEMNQTVMLVDLDFREPSVCPALGIEPEKGIVDYLVDNEPLENILINPGYPRFVVVPCLPRGQHASEFLTMPEMDDFLADVRNRYADRIVIFDAPPLLRNDDAMVFAPKVDACLMIVEDGGSDPADIKRCLQLLDGVQLIGTVLNKAR